MGGCPLTFAGGHATMEGCPLTYVGGHATMGGCPLTFAGGHATMEGCPLTFVGGYTAMGGCPLTFVGGYAAMGGCPLTFVGGYAAMGKCFFVFRTGDYPLAERRSPLQIIDLLRHKALCRPSECFIKLRKHSVARLSASSVNSNLKCNTLQKSKLNNCLQYSNGVL